MAFSCIDAHGPLLISGGDGSAARTEATCRFGPSAITATRNRISPLEANRLRRRGPGSCSPAPRTVVRPAGEPGHTPPWNSAAITARAMAMTPFMGMLLYRHDDESHYT